MESEVIQPTLFNGNRIMSDDEAQSPSFAGSVHHFEAESVERRLSDEENDSSDPTSSDDEPPPAYGRWTNSGGAAKLPKRPSGPREIRDVSDDDEKPAPVRQKAKSHEENLLALHSESQRLMREADVNLPYHEPRQFNKFSEFKAMLDAETEGSELDVRERRPRRKKRTSGSNKVSSDVASDDLKEIKSDGAVVTDKLGTMEPSTSAVVASAEPHAISPTKSVDGAASVDFESLPSRPPSPSAAVASSTPFRPRMLHNPFTSLPVSQINFDMDSELGSCCDERSESPAPDVRAEKDFDKEEKQKEQEEEEEEGEDEPSPLAMRLLKNAGSSEANKLVSSLRNISIGHFVPRLGSPDPSGFIDIRPIKKVSDVDANESVVSNESTTHPMLRRLRRHMDPNRRRSKKKANKSMHIITKTSVGDQEHLRMEEIRLMPPPPVPPRGMSASARAANWRAHRQKLKEEMKIKRLKGLEERHRRWAMYHNEDSGETKKVRSVDDMDSDDEEYHPGEGGSEEEESDDEDDNADDEEEDEDEDEDEEEEENTRKRGRGSEFLDEEAEEEDDEMVKFDDGIGPGGSPMALQLVGDDDDAVMSADLPDSKANSTYSKRLSLSSTTRDLFASDADEISSIRSSASSIFQPNQRSFIVPEESSQSAYSRPVSEYGAQSDDGRLNMEYVHPNDPLSLINPPNDTLIGPTEAASPSTSDLENGLKSISQQATPRHSPVNIPTQGARELFRNHRGSLENNLDAAAKEFFMVESQVKDTKSNASSEDDKDQSILSSDEDLDDVVQTRRRSQRPLFSDDDESDFGATSDKENVEDRLSEDGFEGEETNQELSDASVESNENPDLDDDDDERAVMLRLEKEAKSRDAPKPSDFFEDEAELSGSDGDVSSDENENGLDREDDSDNEWIDKDNADVPSEFQLRRQVERVHARMERDDDQRAVRYLQEIYLPDGDLTPGESLRRRFRWRGLEDREDDDEPVGPFIESDNESEEENQTSFVDDRRPLFAQPAKPSVTTKLNTSAASAESDVVGDGQEESQIFKLGQNALQIRARTTNDSSEQGVSSNPVPKNGLYKRGSFLSKATSDLGRIRDILRQTEPSSFRNKTGVACFSIEAGSGAKTKRQLPTLLNFPSNATKRLSSESYEPSKKVCLSNPTSQPVNSIFHSIDKT